MPPKKRHRRETDPPDPRRETRSSVLNAVLDALQGSWVKIAVLFLGVLLALWGAFRFDDRIDANEAALERLGDRVSAIQGGVRSAAKDLRHINVLLGDLADIRDELVDAVRDAGDRHRPR